MYEMPLLSKLAKPFHPPSRAEVLRFRYTTYFGEAHPAERKVVMEFAPRDLVGLTEAQRGKLIKLVGARFDPARGVVKTSCEMFELQAQNKRYLSDLVDRLILEAKVCVWSRSCFCLACLLCFFGGEGEGEGGLMRGLMVVV